MKKFFMLCAVCCMCLCGCGKEKWQDKIQASEFSWDGSYLTGQMKNVTNNAYNLTIEFSFTSGSLEATDTCYQTIKPDETKDVECFFPNIDKTYKPEIKNVTLTKMEIPALEEGKIDLDTLKYHFENISDQHYDNFASFPSEFLDSNYPYIDEIEYKGDKITINGTYAEGSNVSVYEMEYRTSDNKLTKLTFFESVENEKDFSEKLMTKISLMPAFNKSSKNSIKINEAFHRTDLEEGLCTIVDGWCVATTHENEATIHHVLLDEDAD